MLRSDRATLSSSGPQAATRSQTPRRPSRPRVDEDLVRVVPMTGGADVLRPVDAVRVGHAGCHARDVDVPEVEGPVDTRVEPDGLHRLGRIVTLEEEQFDRRRMLGEQREVGPIGVRCRTQRVRSAGLRGEPPVRRGPGRRHRGCHDVAASAIGGSSSTRFAFAVFVSSATIARPFRVRASPSGLPSSRASRPRRRVRCRHRRPALRSARWTATCRSAGTAADRDRPPGR